VHGGRFIARSLNVIQEQFLIWKINFTIIDWLSIVVVGRSGVIVAWSAVFLRVNCPIWSLGSDAVIRAQTGTCSHIEVPWATSLGSHTVAS